MKDLYNSRECNYSDTPADQFYSRVVEIQMLRLFSIYFYDMFYCSHKKGNNESLQIELMRSQIHKNYFFLIKQMKNWLPHEYYASKNQ